ncbi:MAG: hypothetical protein KAT05_02790 [Spirochaetes bacterium]|nr:hypothetical protein [Spirochaetota bacterium]
MTLQKKIIIFLFLLLSFSLFANSDLTDDQDENKLSWLSNYQNIDPSDDLFYGYSLKNYKISKEYVKNLNWRQDIDFFIPAIDEHNLRQNINILPRFPYVFMLYGGYSYNRAFDIGFLFRADNIANTQLTLTTATSFGQRGKFWVHANVEYPALLKNRLKLLATISFFTSAAQYSCQINDYYDYASYEIKIDHDSSINLIKMIDNIWDKLNINSFYKQHETGLNFVTGLDYRIPFIETNFITCFELIYKYDYYKIDTSSPPSQIFMDKLNFGFNIKQELRWNKFKQTSTIPTGNHLSLLAKFYIPTTIGSPNNEFRFKSRIEEKFNYKIFREFAFKIRLLLGANFNISEDFSGDPYIRGLADYELTGWFALLANLELYIPIVNVEIKSGFSEPFKKDAKFIVYWTFFVDGGFTIENYDYLLDNFIERLSRDKIQNSLDPNNPFGQTYIGNGHYLLPAITAGSGIHVYPFFLHFILRFDIGVNILKAAILQKSLSDKSRNDYGKDSIDCVEFVVSFSQMF